MITAIVLICTIDTHSGCYTVTYANMFDTVEACKNSIEQSLEDELFKTTLDGRLYNLYDYRCIDWNNGFV